MSALTGLVLLGFVVACAAPLVDRYAKGATCWILSLYPAICCGYFISLLPGAADGQFVRESYPWVPQLGMNMSFFGDGLALMFATMISGIGFFIVIYAQGYMAKSPHRGKLYLYLLAFMASMLGLVLADNLLTLFVFWELTSITSYMLVGFDHEKPAARSSALQALLITAGGGLALLAGLLMLGGAGGSMEISELLTATDIREHALYTPIVLLVLIGCFTKSAQFPFHTWLPNAMEAPTPVSAFLHSATMVKAGVFLLARLTPVLGGTALWLGMLSIFGALTAIIGAFFAITSKDVKRMLAYSTVSSLGLMTMLLGIGTPVAVQACVVFLLGHALYKGALFMMAGAIYVKTGTRDLTKLSGLWRAMPRTGLVAIIAAWSMFGLGPLFSFIGKELALGASLAAEQFAPLLTFAAVMAAIASVVIALLIGVRIFFGKELVSPKPPQEANMLLLLGPIVLGVLGLVGGLFPGLAEAQLVNTSILAIMGTAEAPDLEHLYLWHGFNLVLWLSLGAALVGGLAYVGWNRLHTLHGQVAERARFGPQWLYEVSIAGLMRFAAFQTRMLQGNHLRSHIIFIVITAVVLVVASLVRVGAPPTAIFLTDIRIYEAILALIIILAAAFAIRATSRIPAIVGLGVVGLGVAFVYVLYGAPDLAMTQFAVETLTVILFVLVFARLPSMSRLSANKRRYRDGAIALSFGALMTAVVLFASHIEPAAVSTAMAEAAYPEAYGRNVVNVILVDFRSLDTLGEIVVLALAGMGVYALMKFRQSKEGTWSR
jgi:multicomponent Na+:H+ antiporter subunit A